MGFYCLIFKLITMKLSLLLLAILFATASVSANDKMPATATESVSADRYFYVRYTYINATGTLCIGFFGWSCKAGYPKQSDLLLKAAHLTCGDHHCIKIIGVDAVCQSDFNNLFKSSK